MSREAEEAEENTDEQWKKKKRKNKKRRKQKSLLVDWLVPALQASVIMAQGLLRSADPEFKLDMDINECVENEAVKPKVLAAVESAWDLFESFVAEITGSKESPRGYIIQKRVKKSKEVEIIARIKGPRKKEVKEKISIDDVKGVSVAITQGAQLERESGKERKEEAPKDSKPVEQIEAKKDSSKKEEEEADPGTELIYDNVVPFRPAHVDAKLVLEFPSFDQAVDEFFSKVEQRRLEDKASKVERTAISKLNRAQKQHQDRINQLESVCSKSQFLARLIEENCGIVDQCIFATNDLLYQNMDWHAIALRIKEEKSRGNPVAQYIVNLDLHNNSIVLNLPVPAEDEPEEDLEASDFEEPEQKFQRVTVDLGKSAMQNAGTYFGKKKQSRVKMEKTVQAESKATKAAHRKLKKDLASAEEVAKIAKIRRILWWEKFYWFISSDNYLVLGGQDAQQNEALFKKYFDVQRDIYVHAQIHGASTVIIKNPTGGQVPTRTLHEAGCFCACRSKAWSTKVSVQSYWVYGNQVSKTPNTGEYLPTGSFVIRGKKNFMPVQPFIMGFGVLFCIDEESYKARHTNDRRNLEESLDEDAYADLEALPCIPANSATSLASTTTALSEEPYEPSHENEPQRKKVKRNNSEPPKGGELSRPQAKKKMSRAERRRMKKQKQGKGQGPSVKPLAPKAKKTTELPRGKRSKLKRLKKKGKYKYMEYQCDEAEMQLAEELLGMQRTGEMRELLARKSLNEEASNTTQESEEEVLALESNESDTKQEAKGETETESKSEILKDKDCTKSEQNEEKQAEDNAEKEEAEAPLELSDEEEEPLFVQLAQDITGQVNQLTGRPVEEDTLFYAVPVCAPFSVLRNYKYKAKVLPGSTKRGKAVKGLLGRFQGESHSEPEFLKFIKAIKDTEAANSFISNVKVPGKPGRGQKKKQKQKRRKK